MQYASGERLLFYLFDSGTVHDFPAHVFDTRKRYASSGLIPGCALPAHVV